MQHHRPDFPTMEQVERATREQLAKWYRFLPAGEGPQQQRIIERIAERFKEKGGMTSRTQQKDRFLKPIFATVCYHSSRINELS